MQQFDQAPIMKNLHDGIAIVIDGNKAKVAADEGQYILLKNSTITGKEDGGYTAAKDIPADTVLDDTYLSSKLSEGIANSLNDQITNLQGNRWVYGSTTTSSLSGNADQSFAIALPTGVSFADVEAVFFIGYTPSTAWATRLFFKEIEKIDAQSTWKAYVRTDGSTAQTYTMRFAFYKKS